MQIKRQLQLTAWLSGSVVFAILFTLLLASRNLDLDIERSNFAQDFNSSGISGLRAVTVDYVLHRNLRAKTQWQKKHAALKDLLAVNLYEGTREQDHVASLRRDIENLGKVFPLLMRQIDMAAAGAEQQTLRQQTEARLVAQIMTTTQDMVAEAAQLARVSNDHLIAAQRRANLILLAGVLLLGLLIAANLFQLNLTVLTPIRALHRGAEIIGAGNLDHRTGITLNNEVGGLSQAFDAMAAKLAKMKAEVEANTLELQASVEELRAFSYSVSHDLRAPLRGIDGWSLALLEDYGATLDENGKKHLKIVRSETQRMGQMIDDLLQLSRVNRDNFKRNSVDFSQLAQTVADRLLSANPARQIEFVIEPDLTVNADSRLLEIALTNLLGNAVKFTATRAAARIEIGRVAERATGSSAQPPVYFVRDNGVGFDMAHSGKLFGAFQRLHSSSEFPGTGIGLASAQRAIRRHSGKIWADARQGEGAGFYFTLEETP